MLGKKKRRIWLPLAVLLTGTVVAALDARLAVRHYRLETARVSAPVRIALLTDLHSCDYGEGQAGLLEAVAAEGVTAPATRPSRVSRRVTCSPILKLRRSAWAEGSTVSLAPRTVISAGVSVLG